MKGAQQYQALKDALHTATPACTGDPRFVADDLEPADEIRMRSICRSCPVSLECSAYAPHAAAGYWAGAQRGTSTRKRRAA